MVRSSSRRCSSENGTPSSSRLEALAVIEASGVRRSWVTEENSAARVRLVSASSLAASELAGERLQDLHLGRPQAPSSGHLDHPDGPAVRRQRDGGRLEPVDGAGRRPLPIHPPIVGHQHPAARKPVQRPERGGQVLQDVVQRLSGQHSRGHVVKGPDLMLAELGHGPLLQGGGQGRTDQRRHHEEHGQGEQVLGLRHRERVRRGREVVVQADERDGGGQQGRPQAAHGRRRHHREQIQ